MSDDFLSSGYFRNGQEVAVDRSSNTALALINGGSWGFTCANDVIEGVIPVPPGTNVVPVPAPVWLFGSGLLGLAVLARRKRK